ncbi:organic solute transporter Ostalpha-domain-containing protein [Multifurca ochricompacta]|uniref:Organic solute transporter Ostalpha-domain-containing protein n=1 Tax=Multifurca ochricompacta TaxID=376703 RepID=A0AAD4QJ56_9AGAM|nr:organic solute transporter Ostalpha-domain-containing protein [Multifurca ochricompacta]
MSCPSDNTQAVDQSSFWSQGSLHWDAHRVGWAIAGGCSVATVIISAISVFMHCRNYTNRAEQRQILRILYMPPVYAVISFFSYRFFRSYTYYSLIETGALLLIEYVASTAAGHSTEGALARKDKQSLPLPVSARLDAGIICQHYNVLCASGSYSVHFAEVYLDSVDFVSISIALYGLILFYGLTKEELVGRLLRGMLCLFFSLRVVLFLTKSFASIKFNALKDRVIHGTEFWSSTNVADGLNALAICIEMIFFSIFMMWAFSWKEYLVQPGEPHTSIWRPLWESINLWDFAVEIGSELSFFASRLTGRHPHTSGTGSGKAGFGQAFGVEGYTPVGGARKSGGGAYVLPVSRMSYDDDILLAPYTGTHSRGGSLEHGHDMTETSRLGAGAGAVA